MIEPLAQVFTPERPFSTAEQHWTDSVFLAGTIEMGNSVDWQAKAIRRLQDMPINIFNPRRVVPPDEKLIAEQINGSLTTSLHVASSTCIWQAVQSHRFLCMNLGFFRAVKL